METYKTIKFTAFSFLLLVMFISIMMLFSPYGKIDKLNKKAITTEIDINVSPSKVFQYLGDSSTAADWSSYVNAIEPLNDKIVKDGTVGSKRRCFAKEDGIVWDEEILSVVPNRERLLSVFNAKGFPMMADNLLTKQIYIPLKNGTTKLQLSLFFSEGQRDFFSELKMYFAAYFIEDIFLANLENIKAINESSQS